MKQNVPILLTILLLTACGSDAPPSYGGVPKQTLDQVSKDVEQATDEAKEKIDSALKNIE